MSWLPFPGYQRLKQLSRQVARICPFQGDIKPTRIPLFQVGSGRPTLPFPHPWNYDQPLKILETFFWRADREEGSGRHNRYLDVPGFATILVTRDPGVIRAICTDTGDKEGQFDRDTLPSKGIARATGKDTLLYSNGALWKHQRMICASPFGKTSLFDPTVFHDFTDTFRNTVTQRLEALRQLLKSSGQTISRLQLEPEIRAVMLELIAINFFGAEVAYDELRDRYVPALGRVIDSIVTDTVKNPLGIRVTRLPSFTGRIARLKQDYAAFEELTDRVLVGRGKETGLWKKFKSEAPDKALRSNIKVFLAGALEATTSYASWAISHLARNSEAQEKVFGEVKDIDEYIPDNLEQAKYFSQVLEETLRLTPSLYFLPRRTTRETRVETADNRSIVIPQGVHVLLDVWHANRHEDYWGVAATGYPALDFVPERWAELAERGRVSKDTLHFGFGHGPRVCPGKHLGQLEVGLVVGAFVKLFRFHAVDSKNEAKAGVSTKPSDGTLVELQLRETATGGGVGGTATAPVG